MLPIVGAWARDEMGAFVAGAAAVRGADRQCGSVQAYCFEVF